MVDVDGTQVAVELRGSQEPPVVFLSGVTDDRHVWDAVIALLPHDNMTLTYDRPGLGDSSTLRTIGPKKPEGATRTAERLQAIIQALNVPEPIVLVGHSLGALIAHVYAAQSPERCAGLILVDPSDPELLPPLAGFTDALSDSAEGTQFSWHAIGQDVAAAVPTAPAVVIASAPGRWHRVSDPDSYKPLDMRTVDTRWQAWQRTLADRLNATLIIATEAGHRVHTEAPSLIAATIQHTIAAIRASVPPIITTDHLTGAPGVIVSTTGKRPK